MSDLDISAAIQEVMTQVEADIPEALMVKASWLCSFGLHRWARWDQADVGSVTTDGKKVGIYYEQTRTCIGCGLDQHRAERA